MAWTFDQANTGVTENDSNAQTTLTHTTGTLTNGILFVWAATSTTTVTITSATYGVQTLTEAVAQTGTNLVWQ